MTWVDYAVLGVLLLSALIGLWRGFVREVFALIGWIAASVLALSFATPLAAVFPQDMASPFVKQMLAAVLIFVLVLICATLAAFLVRRMLQALGLNPLDRALGAAFGLARGLVLVVVAVVIAGLTEMPHDAAWREARLRGPLETAGIAAKAYLPPAVAGRIRYERKP